MLARSYCIIILFLIFPSVCQEKNTTNIFDIRDEHHKTIKYIAVLLFIIFLLYSLTTNLLMTIVLFSRRQDNYSQAFVLIALQIIISHFLGFIPQLVVVIPEILQTKNNLFANQTTWINNTFSTFLTFPIYGILHFTYLLALNRFVVFILPKYNAFFKTARLYFLIILVWLTVSAITVGDYYFCARKFLVWNLSWKRDCAKSNGKGETWWRIRDVWALILPSIMFIMYIAIFYSIRRKQRSTADINRDQNDKKILAGHGANAVKTYDYERSLLFQAALYCGMMEVGVISFNILPTLLIQIFGERIAIPLGIIRNCYIIFACTILPTIHFICSKEERNIVKEYFVHFLHLKTEPLKTTVFISSARINIAQYNNSLLKLMNLIVELFHFCFIVLMFSPKCNYLYTNFLFFFLFHAFLIYS
uniref:G_PROTEIN_RECEP_F1_2 domain-containing protein n=1 Tax=Onchocerca volvulus TaxID=6282 RepID=A0A8R1XNP9_ONCVO